MLVRSLILMVCRRGVKMEAVMFVCPRCNTSEPVSETGVTTEFCNRRRDEDCTLCDSCVFADQVENDSMGLVWGSETEVWR